MGKEQACRRECRAGKEQEHRAQDAQLSCQPGAPAQIPSGGLFSQRGRARRTRALAP